MRIAGAFIAVLAVLGIFVNFYPAILLRDQLLRTKEHELVNDAVTFSAALSGFSYLNEETVTTALSVLDLMNDRRIVVVNSSCLVIYDSLQNTALKDRIALFPEIVTALRGQDVFRCTYDSAAFESRSSSPVIIGDEIVGAVFFYDHDTEPSAMMKNMRMDIFVVSIIVAAVCTVFIFLFTGSMGRRIKMLMDGIREVGKGNYDYSIRMDRADELSLIADEFNDLTARLQRNDEQRRQLVSDAAHELKTPLASIKLLSDSILQASHMDPEDTREFLTDISDQIERLTRITEGLLSITKLDSLPEVVLEPCDIVATIMKSRDLLKINTELNDVTLTLHINDDPYVMATSDGLYHVIFNLMENAVKYNRPGGTVDVHLSTIYGGRVKLVVSDTGIGIPHSEQQKIFERFYRVDKARSRDTGGTGLGLSIVRDWVESMDGTIELQSAPGVGSTFTVIFKEAEKEMDI